MDFYFFRKSSSSTVTAMYWQYSMRFTNWAGCVNAQTLPHCNYTGGSLTSIPQSKFMHLHQSPAEQLPVLIYFQGAMLLISPQQSLDVKRDALQQNISTCSNIYETCIKLTPEHDRAATDCGQKHAAAMEGLSLMYP